MYREGYEDLINWKVDAIRRDAGVDFTCWASPEGLPDGLLYSPDPLPPTYARMLTPPDGLDDVKLKSYLKNEVGLIEGEDFVHHHNGMRGGECYFDFRKPDAIQRLEAFMAERGLTPGEKPDPNNPSQELIAFREQKAREYEERYERETAERNETLEALGIGKKPFSFLRYLTKSTPRSR